MQRYNNVLRDAEGNAVADSTVDIFVGDSLTRATLYDGSGDPVSNPVTTDSRGTIINDTLSADPLDAIGFKAAAGRYRIEGSKDGQALGPIPDILIGDAQGKDTGPAQAQLPTNADLATAGTYPKRNAGGTDWESTTPGALLTDLQAARFDDLYADFVLSGLLPAASADLTSDISAGQAYVTGRRIDKAATIHTYTASVDTYVDLDSAGTYLFTEVANGGAEPAQPAGSIRLAKVVTDAAAITSVADLRETIAKRKGELDYYLKAEADSKFALKHGPVLDVGLSAVFALGHGAFTKIPLDNVITDTEGGWDATNNEYVVPVSGVYSVVSKIRPRDAGTTGGLPQDASYGQGVHTSATDGAWFIWGFGSPKRHGLLNERIWHLTAGERIFLYAYQDSGGTVDVIDNGTSMSLFLIRRD